MIEKSVRRLMIGMGVPLASALVLEQLPKTGVAEVPFAFQVEEQTLPPGTYSVKQADHGRGVRIQNAKVASARMECIAAKHTFGTTQDATLVFDRYKGQYFLSQIWFEADGRGLVLPENHIGKTAPGLRDVRYVHFQ